MSKATEQNNNLTCLAQVNDENRLFEVYENEDLRWLSIDGCVQTAMSLERPDALMFPHMLFMVLPLNVMHHVSRALELGLGGGGILRHLSTHFPKIQIEVVEYESTVIELYQRHFNPQQQNHTIHCMDARQFMSNLDSQPFDLIFVDVFDSEQPVPLMFEPDFYQDLKKHADNTGWIVLNTVLTSQSHLEKLHKILSETFLGATIYGYKAEQFANFVWLISLDNTRLDPIWRAQALFELKL
ncbi:hypothetical protein N480_10885 [Pseudoalteromonas luteoviolacea S2607]|uniref:spermidine synthase n=1 Tax=Pseudoalteromonas luteoviolacea TaxID=43657 RepID=UPI0007B03FB3|nr:fused MFS/spermidine synthase [Pseudoalteromonas luteoviolacea]KZN28588.1 hypothetical protein N480_10885 [Pseudoalteromonas luteoviolacea S2607]